MTDINLTTLNRMKADGRKIAVLTAYDASFARVLAAAGVDVILIGDSLGMVIQGHGSTLPVRIDDMAYHSACVARAAAPCFIIADLPFLTYTSRVQALENAGRLLAEGGAHMVKLEGGRAQLAVVEALAEQGIPVCAHLGLTPQSVHRFGGYRVQGRDPAQADTIARDALDLQNAGAQMLVLECVPAPLAARITASLAIPTIGIGAGVDCDGQVLVLHDLLGVFPGKTARFVRNFMDGAASIEEAVARYVAAVKDGSFPAAEHCY